MKKQKMTWEIFKMSGGLILIKMVVILGGFFGLIGYGVYKLLS